MDSFLIFVSISISTWSVVNGQLFPRQIMPINAAASQPQFNNNPFLSNYQLMKMQQQIQQQQQQLLQQQQQAMFQQAMAFPMQQRTQGILQSPGATAGDISNPQFQQQQSKPIPFQVSFSGRKSNNEQVATPFHGGGLVPVTEKLLDSNPEQIPSSVGNTKRDTVMPDMPDDNDQSLLQPVTTPPSTESLPPFLQGAPKDIVDEFKRILRQPQLSYDAKVAQVEALMLTLSPDRQQMYHQFMGQQQQQQLISSTPPTPSTQLLYRQPTRLPPARMPHRSPPNDDGFSRITRILQDESIPENERWQKIVGIYGEAEPRVKSENPFAFDGLMY